MSIYRRRNWYDLDGQHGPSTQSKAVKPRVDSFDWSKLRKAAPVDYLLPVAKTWMEGLPPEVAPLATARQYPRIVNLIAADWNDSAGCRALFEELLGDRRRGNRQGFPGAVERELQSLHAYWYKGSGP